jgi:sterol desaturase/sphingolipid hydroxylase (fatty acid hydroxylase superfamily)
MEYLETHGKIIISVYVLLIFILERIIYKNYFKIDTLSNTKLRLFKNISFGILVKIVIPIFIIYIVKNLQYTYLWKLPQNWLVYLIDVLVLDLSLYWFHFYAHKNPLIWKFHEIHHSDNILDSTTGLRIHFTEPVIALLFKLPAIFILAIPVKIYILYEIILTIVGVFHHSNIKVPLLIDKYVGAVIALPSTHCVHHHATPRDTNSNYGFVFLFWDVLFGTLNKVERQKNWKYGLKYAEDKAFIKLLYYPFTNKHFRNL